MNVYYPKIMALTTFLRFYAQKKLAEHILRKGGEKITKIILEIY